LREGLRGHEEEELALRLMADHEVTTEDEAAESASELRNLLNRLLIDRLTVQETEALEEAKADPSAYLRYREFYNRRRALQSALSQAG